MRGSNVCVLRQKNQTDQGYTDTDFDPSFVQTKAIGTVKKNSREKSKQ